MSQSSHEPPIIERQSLCMSTSEPGETIHAGQPGFKSCVARHFQRSENDTAERLINFKQELKGLDPEPFWARLMEGMADMCHAQFAFVSKRILVNDHDTAVEMPALGEAGSCLMGVALYWNNGPGLQGMSRDYKYYAWGAPCSYMRHDKVFLCPHGISDLTADNPNQMPFACDAYLGIPLFADGKCFAHFGLMWTKEGLERKQGLSWGYLEMLLHSLEDMIADRLLAGHGFAKSNTAGRRSEVPEPAKKVIPMASVTSAQSLKPYARSLSHELRTPMQGVVGMLDVMYATVQEQIEAMANSKVRRVFQTLKDNIETVQDSSKRAVEAADNVVHAYDLNMQIPDTPLHDLDSPSQITSYFDFRPKMIEGSNIVNPHKRRRSSPNIWSFGNPTKIRHKEKSETPRSPLAKIEFAKPISPPRETSITTPDEPTTARTSLLTPSDADYTSPGSRQSNIRNLIPVVINDALRIGGRPDSAISEPTQFGGRTEVRTRSSNGDTSQKTIEWHVDEDVPELVAMDERDLSKLITQVFLNANKYTEVGLISLHARMSNSRRYVVIRVADTGSGIPEDFQPELFKPFSKEDHSLTRSKEGLGLGLLVAKGVARRVGGDIVLVRSSTEDPHRGTEFEIRVPLDHSDVPSRSSTPLHGTPEPHPRRNSISQSTSRQPHANTSAPRDRSVSPPRSPCPTIKHRVPAPSVPPTSTSPKTTPHVPEISKIINAASQVAASGTPPASAVPRSLTKPVARRTISSPVTKKDIMYDRELAQKYPLTFLVAEDNKINRKLLVNMLSKFGYRDVYEAFDGKEAVRIMESLSNNRPPNKMGGKDLVKAVDVILMDLWMPEMDGYEATEKILAMFQDLAINESSTGFVGRQPPIVLAVSADVTEAAVDRATRIGMQGYMTKPYMLTDLQRLIVEFCGTKAPVA